MNQIDISIIIVHYNTPHLIHDCLRAITRGLTAHMEIILVDNGSRPDHVESLKKIIQHYNEKVIIIPIWNNSNVGFSKGNNIGITTSRGKYIVLLNSDTEVAQTTIEHLYHFMDTHEDVDAYTPKLVLPQGSIDPACHRGFPTPWASLCYFLGLERIFHKSKLFGEYHQTYKDLDTIHEIDCPSGAFFCIRRRCLEKTGTLDEQFFMYGEDIDLAYRIRQQGGKILYDPTTVVLHKKKQSGRSHLDKVQRRVTRRHFWEAMELFYAKHYAQSNPAIVTMIVTLCLRIIKATI